MTEGEALAVLFTGQANVAKMAAAVGIPTEEMKTKFAAYAVTIPLTDEVWEGDVEMAWPFA